MLLYEEECNYAYKKNIIVASGTYQKVVSLHIKDLVEIKSVYDEVNEKIDGDLKKAFDFLNGGYFKFIRSNGFYTEVVKK